MKAFMTAVVNHVRVGSWKMFFWEGGNEVGE